MIEEEKIKIQVSTLTILMVGMLCIGLSLGAILVWSSWSPHVRCCVACGTAEPRPQQLYMCPGCREKLEKNP